MAVAFSGERLAVCDTGNNRVLLYRSVQDSSASTVIGQLSPHGCGAGSGPGQLDRPSGVALDGSRLAVCDVGSGRVLVYEDVGRLPAAGATADLVVGAWDGGAGRHLAASFSSLTDVALEGEYLAVLDRGSSRVTLFALSGGSATVALDAAVAGGSWDPTSVSISDGRLAVADSRGQRILVWEQIGSLSAGVRPDRVIELYPVLSPLLPLAKLDGPSDGGGEIYARLAGHELCVVVALPEPLAVRGWFAEGAEVSELEAFALSSLFGLGSGTAAGWCGLPGAPGPGCWLVPDPLNHRVMGYSISPSTAPGPR
ncbi:MAG: hypothetical protein HYY25_14845 [Candidatus Wallbacteria bacterium]|nr:hypothetical protein [Candidatus Wallbacteria bacterium]